MQEQVDTLSKYGQSFQSKVLSALLVDGKFLDTISEITTPKFFENDASKWIVSEILEYHDGYRQPPTLDVFKSQLSKVDKSLKYIKFERRTSKTGCSATICGYSSASVSPSNSMATSSLFASSQ